jgi:hypothetical protein
MDTMHLTPAIISLIHDLAKAIGPRSPGGRKISPEEGKAIAQDAYKLAEQLLKMVGNK